MVLETGKIEAVEHLLERVVPLVLGRLFIFRENFEVLTNLKLVNYYFLALSCLKKYSFGFLLLVFAHNCKKTETEIFVFSVIIFEPIRF